jgi:hypothetical protein
VREQAVGVPEHAHGDVLGVGGGDERVPVLNGVANSHHVQLHEGDHDEQGGGESEKATNPKSPKPHGPGLFGLVEEQSGDEVPGEHEEHGDPDRAGDPRRDVSVR